MLWSKQKCRGIHAVSKWSCLLTGWIDNRNSRCFRRDRNPLNIGLQRLGWLRWNWWMPGDRHGSSWWRLGSEDDGWLAFVCWVFAVDFMNPLANKKQILGIALSVWRWIRARRVYRVVCSMLNSNALRSNVCTHGRFLCALVCAIGHFWAQKCVRYVRYAPMLRQKMSFAPSPQKTPHTMPTKM